MSKLTTFLSSNASLVGGVVAVTTVALVALVANGVLGPQEMPTAEPATQAAVEAPKTIKPQEDAVDEPAVASEPKEDTTETAATAPIATEEVAVEESTAADESSQEETVAPDVAETAQTETEAPIETLPVFDLVRIEPDGEGQIAGTAAPHALVALLLDGGEIARVQADASGKFFTFITLGPNPQPRELLLVERRAAGDLTSESSFLVAPIAAPVVIAQAEDETSEAVDEATAEQTEDVVDDAAQVAESETGETDSEAEQMQTAQSEPAQSEPKAPAVLVSDSDGVRVVQPAGSSDEPEVESAVSIDAISYSEGGSVVVAGRGLPDGFVRLYLNNALALTTRVDASGVWSAELLDVDSGLYTMRADEVNADGKVLSRVETPFKRETPERVAEAQAIAQASQSADEPAVEDAPAASEAEATEEPDVTVTKEVPSEEQPAENAVVASSEEEASAPSREVASNAVEEPEKEAAEADPVKAETQPAPETETAQTATPAQPAVQIVTVQPGSSLWAIARDRYGEGTMYVRVFEANQDKIRNPDLIYPGQVFTVPE
ncbi:nucleoid-associated protein YgaU [Shimia isoporae]|uniref:Nucleoid-associated protein YgaU n=1 Tax=Shimia isoporae TaxID=647720 RepID=A0A4R1NQV1_9RHOB|nr:LysM peptidoglycan-binding domain-containing protein [Shimia isoporae]TCL09103.1 nucleoid-associated protein YgaU [Shimia isoporae]